MIVMELIRFICTLYKVFRNTSGADCTLKNNEKKKLYKYMSYLSSFMRYNEFSVLITFTKDARNGKPATRLVIHLVALSVIPAVSRICREPFSILFRSISAFSIDVACTIDFKCAHK